MVNISLSDLNGHEDAKPQRFWNHDLDLLKSCDVIGHVTNELAAVTFLLVVNDDHASILHRYGDIKPQSCVQLMLSAKSLLRMPDVTWPVGRGQKWLHIWSSRCYIVYSLYNFYGATMTTKGRLKVRILYRSIFGRNFKSVFGPNFWTWGIFLGLHINFEFFYP